MLLVFSNRLRRFVTGAATAILICSTCFEISVLAQETEQLPGAQTGEDNLATASEVEIDPVAEDVDITSRLRRILDATGWFDGVTVNVDEGVVFLEGTANSSEHKDWAGTLCRNTESVVAVVNRLKVQRRSLWDLSPAWAELRDMLDAFIQRVPSLGLACIILVATWFGWLASTRLARKLLATRLEQKLLINVLARTLAIPVALAGVYLALRVSGLTQIAATLLGGTGLIGLVIGIAFRDIAENFLASLLITIQRPFRLGDLIKIDEHQGFVQGVSTRGTLLMTLDGNHVQIPNASIYKSIIYNFTANPNVRVDFVLGIDYADAVTEAQRVISELLGQHEAVLDEPKPMILVDELGASTVNLKVYFWINGHEHSLLKVRSSVIRQAKAAIESAGLTMPDESREIIFPKGVPIRDLRIADENPVTESEETAQRSLSSQPTEPDEHRHIEEDLSSEKDELDRQAENSSNEIQGQNLLEEESGPDISSPKATQTEKSSV